MEFVLGLVDLSSGLVDFVVRASGFCRRGSWILSSGLVDFTPHFPDG